jgi:hypothetical protein
MEEGRQKSKTLSYTAKFKREVIRCAEGKGNRKAAAIFGVDESNIQLWRKHKAAISGREASRRKFTGPKKGRFTEIDDAVFTFSQERRKTGLFVSYDLLREEAIKIFEHYSKANTRTHPAIAHRINTVTIFYYSTLFGNCCCECKN